MAPPKRPVIERIFERCVRNEDTGCLEYQGWLHRGYGYIADTDGRNARVHIIVFREANGFQPPMVCHSCDNRKCCEEEHLFAGTGKVNTADMWSKGRQGLKMGPEHPANSLTAMQVIAIRNGLAHSRSRRDLAKEHGVTRSVIDDIANGRRYKWVASSEPGHN